jgi:hypothetical protein
MKGYEKRGGEVVAGGEGKWEEGGIKVKKQGWYSRTNMLKEGGKCE